MIEIYTAIDHAAYRFANFACEGLPLTETASVFEKGHEAMVEALKSFEGNGFKLVPMYNERLEEARKLLLLAQRALAEVRNNETAMMQLRPQEQATVRNAYNALADFIFGPEETWFGKERTSKGSGG